MVVGDKKKFLTVLLALKVQRAAGVLISKLFMYIFIHFFIPSHQPTDPHPQQTPTDGPRRAGRVHHAAQQGGARDRRGHRLQGGHGGGGGQGRGGAWVDWNLA